MNTSLNHLWAGLIVEELVRHGVDCFCLASGSRSAPLAMNIAGRKGVRLVVHVDERSTAHAALGYARATGRPAVWVTTSGTAAANGLPAVIEAAQDRVPLILLTADRPPELRDCGANQTIDQVRLFGTYVRWQFDMPCPSRELTPPMVLTTVDQAVYRSTRSPAGPVHLNCMFREPLTPGPKKQDHDEYLLPIRNWQSGRDPFTHYAPSRTHPDESVFDRLIRRAEKAGRGMVVLGKLNAHERNAVREIVEHISWPVLPDVTSGFRLGSSPEQTISHYDQILLSEKYRNILQPDFIWHIGGAVTSKRLQEFMRDSEAFYAVMKDHPFRQDPFHKADAMLETDLHAAAVRFQTRPVKTASSVWQNNWETASKYVDTELTRLFSGNGPVDEPFVARLVSRHIPRDHGLFLAGSMPIRDMDMFGYSAGKGPAVEANRGASGIDGTVSTAAGYALGLDRPVTLLIGDLALLHDLSALRLFNELDVPVTTIVLNNNGGGIFSFLPVSRFPDTFESCFGTPHDLSFEHAAHLFDLAYEKPETRASFEETYRNALRNKKSCLIEVVTNRTENVETHQAIWDSVRERLDRDVHG